MSKNYVIESFMTGSLGLSGNELVLFAILWKESEQGSRQVEGDYTAISQRMGTTIPTMYNCLKDLVKTGILEQTGKCEYKCKESYF